MGKVIHWELYKKFKLNYTNKWYMHNTESIHENETYKILWDFDTQTVYLISTRRPDHMIINKKQRSWWIVDFAVLADHRIKLKENENRDKYLGLARELKTYGTQKCARYSLQRISKETGRLGNKRTSGDQSNDSTVKIRQNTEKNPGDLKGLTVAQTPGKNH